MKIKKHGYNYTIYPVTKNGKQYVVCLNMCLKDACICGDIYEQNVNRKMPLSSNKGKLLYYEKLTEVTFNDGRRLFDVCLLNEVENYVDNIIDILFDLYQKYIDDVNAFDKKKKEREEQLAERAVRNEMPQNIVERRLRELISPHGVIVGDSLERSFEITEAQIREILKTRDDKIIVIDTDGRYSKLANELDGQIIRFMDESETHINPFDIYEYKQDPDGCNNEFQLCHKIDLMHVFVSNILNRNLTATERSLIDFCVKNMYDTQKEKPNLKVNLQELVINLDENPFTTVTDEKPGKKLAATLSGFAFDERFDMFAFDTNVNHEKRFVVYDLSNIPKELISLFELIVFDHVSTMYIIPTNDRNERIHTWLFVNKMDELIQDENMSQYILGATRRLRKHWGVLTGILQLVNLNNSAYQLLANMSYIHLTGTKELYQKRDLKQLLSIDEDIWNNDNEEYIMFGHKTYCTENREA